MTREQLQRELRYRAAMALVKELLKAGIISEEDYQAADQKMMAHFQSILLGLYPNNPLIQ